MDKVLQVWLMLRRARLNVPNTRLDARLLDI